MITQMRKKTEQYIMDIQFLLLQALFTEFIYHTVFAINRFLIFSPPTRDFLQFSIKKIQVKLYNDDIITCNESKGIRKQETRKQNERTQCNIHYRNQCKRKPISNL